MCCVSVLVQLQRSSDKCVPFSIPSLPPLGCLEHVRFPETWQTVRGTHQQSHHLSPPFADEKAE